MRKSIGSAADFYRLRVRTVDATDAVDLEWRDDILYRRPPGETIQDLEYVAVEAVLLGNDAISYVLATFEDRAEAHAWLAECEEDLAEMTRSEFEAAFFPEGQD